MKYRALGQDLQVSALGLGCMPMISGDNILYGVRRSNFEKKLSRSIP